MVTRVRAKYLRVSPRKVRLVINQLRGRSVAEAYSLLDVINRGASRPVRKALRSAVANAQQIEPELPLHELIISRITADGGPTLRRWRAAPMGRAVMVRKHTTHLVLELDRRTTATSTDQQER